MSGVTIPTRFEANLALGDGSAGAATSELLELTCSQVDNLYTFSPPQFIFSFQVLSLSLRPPSFRGRLSTGARRSLWGDGGQ